MQILSLFSKDKKAFSINLSLKKYIFYKTSLKGKNMLKKIKECFPLYPMLDWSYRWGLYELL